MWQADSDVVSCFCRRLCQPLAFLPVDDARTKLVVAKGVDHHHDESAVIHIQPVGTADELIGAVSGERAVNILA